MQLTFLSALLLALTARASPVRERAASSPAAAHNPLANLEALGYQHHSLPVALGLGGQRDNQGSPVKPTPDSGCGQNCNSTLSFAGAKARAYQVGNEIPGIPFRTKTSWAGNIATDATGLSSFFFWLWGHDTKQSDDLVIWLNGGPGCSSLFGFMTENGPFNYEFEGETPKEREYTWLRAANVIWVEQPIGVGFTRGPTLTLNEDIVAAQFEGFLGNLYATFPELKSKKLWITGESYAGQYIPYVSSRLFKNGNKFNLQGNFIIDGLITDRDLMEGVVSYKFSKDNKDRLKFTDADVAAIKGKADQCGYTTYVEDNLAYPPKGHIAPFQSDSCGVFSEFVSRASAAQECFNIYKIDDECHPPPVLGEPNDVLNFLNSTYFNRPGIQNYLHTGPLANWQVCNRNIFLTFDPSPPTDSAGLITYITEQAPSGRTIIVNGQRDAVIQTDGAALALQNISWNGVQGFQESPYQRAFIDDQGNAAGHYVTERGLTFAILEEAGHEVPKYTPAAGFKLLQFLLGQVSSLGA